MANENEYYTYNHDYMQECILQLTRPNEFVFFCSTASLFD